MKGLLRSTEAYVTKREDYFDSTASIRKEKMMQRSLGGWPLSLVALPLLTVVFGLMLMATVARAATVTNIDIPVSGVVFNPCNGEIVTFSGVEHFTASMTLDGSGGFVLDRHNNIHVTATGNLGNTYVANQEDYSEFNGPVGSEATSRTTFREISQGFAPNFVIHALMHVIVNPDGTVTAFVDYFNAECQG